MGRIQAQILLTQHKGGPAAAARIVCASYLDTRMTLWQVQKWDDGIHYEEGERYTTPPKWCVVMERRTSVECLAALVDIANSQCSSTYFGDRYRVLCNSTGRSQEVAMGPLVYQDGSHLDLQIRLRKMFKSLVLEGYSPEEARRLTNQEQQKAYR